MTWIDTVSEREALRLAITFGGSRLGRRKEELIALVVSVLNKCHQDPRLVAGIESTMGVHRP